MSKLNFINYYDLQIEVSRESKIITPITSLTALNICETC